MQTSAASAVKAKDIASFLFESRNNDNAIAAPADTIVAWPEGYEYSFGSCASKKSDSGIVGCGLCTISLAANPIGIRTMNARTKTIAVFLPVIPPRMNKRIIVAIQNASLPYSVSQTIILLRKETCESFTFKNADVSLSAIPGLLFASGDTNTAKTTNKAKMIIEAA